MRSQFNRETDTDNQRLDGTTPFLTGM